MDKNHLVLKRISDSIKDKMKSISTPKYRAFQWFKRKGWFAIPAAIVSYIGVGTLVAAFPYSIGLASLESFKYVVTAAGTLEFFGVSALTSAALKKGYKKMSCINDMYAVKDKLVDASREIKKLNKKLEKTREPNRQAKILDNKRYCLDETLRVIEKKLQSLEDRIEKAEGTKYYNDLKVVYNTFEAVHKEVEDMFFKANEEYENISHGNGNGASGDITGRDRSINNDNYNLSTMLTDPVQVGVNQKSNYIKATIFGNSDELSR